MAHYWKETSFLSSPSSTTFQVPVDVAIEQPDEELDFTLDIDTSMENLEPELLQLVSSSSSDTSLDSSHEDADITVIEARDRNVIASGDNGMVTLDAIQQDLLAMQRETMALKELLAGRGVPDGGGRGATKENWQEEAYTNEERNEGVLLTPGMTTTTTSHVIYHQEFTEEVVTGPGYHRLSKVPSDDLSPPTTDPSRQDSTPEHSSEEGSPKDLDRRRVSRSSYKQMVEDMDETESEEEESLDFEGASTEDDQLLEISTDEMHIDPQFLPTGATVYKVQAEGVKVDKDENTSSKTEFRYSAMTATFDLNPTLELTPEERLQKIHDLEETENVDKDSDADTQTETIVKPYLETNLDSILFYRTYQQQADKLLVEETNPSTENQPSCEQFEEGKVEGLTSSESEQDLHIEPTTLQPDVQGEDFTPEQDLHIEPTTLQPDVQGEDFTPPEESLLEPETCVLEEEVDEIVEKISQGLVTSHTEQLGEPEPRTVDNSVLVKLHIETSEKYKSDSEEKSSIGEFPTESTGEFKPEADDNSAVLKSHTELSQESESEMEGNSEEIEFHPKPNEELQSESDESSAALKSNPELSEEYESESEENSDEVEFHTKPSEEPETDETSTVLTSITELSQEYESETKEDSAAVEFATKSNYAPKPESEVSSVIIEPHTELSEEYEFKVETSSETGEDYNPELVDISHIMSHPKPNEKSELEEGEYSDGNIIIQEETQHEVIRELHHQSSIESSSEIRKEDSVKVSDSKPEADVAVTPEPEVVAVEKSETELSRKFNVELIPKTKVETPSLPDKETKPKDIENEKLTPEQNLSPTAAKAPVVKSFSLNDVEGLKPSQTRVLRRLKSAQRPSCPPPPPPSKTMVKVSTESSSGISVPSQVTVVTSSGLESPLSSASSSTASVSISPVPDSPCSPKLHESLPEGPGQEGTLEAPEKLVTPKADSGVVDEVDMLNESQRSVSRVHEELEKIEIPEIPPPPPRKPPPEAPTRSSFKQPDFSEESSKGILELNYITLNLEDSTSVTSAEESSDPDLSSKCQDDNLTEVLPLVSDASMFQEGYAKGDTIQLPEVTSSLPTQPSMKPLDELENMDIPVIPPPPPLRPPPTPTPRHFLPVPETPAERREGSVSPQLRVTTERLLQELEDVEANATIPPPPPLRHPPTDSMMPLGEISTSFIESSESDEESTSDSDEDSTSASEDDSLTLPDESLVQKNEGFVMLQESTSTPATQISPAQILNELEMMEVPEIPPPPPRMPPPSVQPEKLLTNSQTRPLMVPLIPATQATRVKNDHILEASSNESLTTSTVDVSSCAEEIELPKVSSPHPDASPDRTLLEVLNDLVTINIPVIPPPLPLQPPPEEPQKTSSLLIKLSTSSSSESEESVSERNLTQLQVTNEMAMDINLNASLNTPSQEPPLEKPNLAESSPVVSPEISPAYLHDKGKEEEIPEVAPPLSHKTHSAVNTESSPTPTPEVLQTVLVSDVTSEGEYSSTPSPLLEITPTPLEVCLTPTEVSQPQYPGEIHYLNESLSMQVNVPEVSRMYPEKTEPEEEVREFVEPMPEKPEEKTKEKKRTHEHHNEEKEVEIKVRNLQEPDQGIREEQIKENIKENIVCQTEAFQRLQEESSDTEMENYYTPPSYPASSCSPSPSPSPLSTRKHFTFDHEERKGISEEVQNPSGSSSPTERGSYEESKGEVSKLLQLITYKDTVKAKEKISSTDDNFLRSSPSTIPDFSDVGKRHEDDDSNLPPSPKRRRLSYELYNEGNLDLDGQEKSNSSYSSSASTNEESESEEEVQFGGADSCSGHLDPTMSITTVSLPTSHRSLPYTSPPTEDLHSVSQVVRNEGEGDSSFQIHVTVSIKTSPSQTRPTLFPREIQEVEVTAEVNEATPPIRSPLAIASSGSDGERRERKGLKKSKKSEERKKRRTKDDKSSEGEGQKEDEREDEERENEAKEKNVEKKKRTKDDKSSDEEGPNEEGGKNEDKENEDDLDSNKKSKEEKRTKNEKSGEEESLKEKEGKNEENDKIQEEEKEEGEKELSKGAKKREGKVKKKSKKKSEKGNEDKSEEQVKKMKNETEENVEDKQGKKVKKKKREKEERKKEKKRKKEEKEEEEKTTTTTDSNNEGEAPTSRIPLPLPDLTLTACPPSRLSSTHSLPI
ncbi:hypothetical protein Pcinc_036474 [Petrolisthes cinctipes]|uniref:Uncharacterized protein n=1 Tax=Petrolisthes cinctipes TaxID=88211 RepID=A0AAE1EPI1_PETCI|nr:hypothetical protein Pcinc_036474 [Petrolisthes cinctipes]